MAPPRPDRPGSFRYVTVVHVLVVLSAWWGFESSDAHPMMALGVGYAVSVAVTLAAGVHSRNGSVFDPWWSVLPPFAALWVLGLSDAAAVTPQQLAVLVVVFFWAVRLTSNWARDWPGLGHEDWRYTNLYARSPLPQPVTMFLAVMTVPALFVWLGSLPLVPALTQGDGQLGVLGACALVLGLAATCLALVADEQMRSFRQMAQLGALMDQGLWAWSRHPNYLGEILFWVSLWLFALNAAPSSWWTVVGPLGMVGLFVFASIPLLDERSRERRPAFEAYAARTPALLLRPPRRP
jgi:steroid 5-alpha reductase family enzyme